MNRLLLGFVLLLTTHAAHAATYTANPTNYKSILSKLEAGDVMTLAAGNYTGGLRISNLRGTSTARIQIVGAAMGTPATFLGDPYRRWNTVELVNASYITIKNLRIDGRNIPDLRRQSTVGSCILLISRVFCGVSRVHRV
jgi:hypothetical protein